MEYAMNMIRLAKSLIFLALLVSVSAGASAAAADVLPSWNDAAARARIVAFVQERASRRVLGTTTASAPVSRAN